MFFLVREPDTVIKIVIYIFYGTLYILLRENSLINHDSPIVHHIYCYRHSQKSYVVICSSTHYMNTQASSHLLIVGLHTQEDGVCCEAGQTAFDIWLAAQLFCFSIQVVQCPHRLFKLLFINLRQRISKGLQPQDKQRDRPMGKLRGYTAPFTLQILCPIFSIFR